MKIYIAYVDYGAEGCSAPLEAFLNKDEADRAVRLAHVAHAPQLKLKELNVAVDAELMKQIYASA